jgi:hypothetical protein
MSECGSSPTPKCPVQLVSALSCSRARVHDTSAVGSYKELVLISRLPESDPFPSGERVVDF